MSDDLLLPTTTDESRQDGPSEDARLAEAVLALTRARDRGDRQEVRSILERYADLRDQLLNLLELESFFGLNSPFSDPLRQLYGADPALKYELLEEVASGAYGQVLKGRDRVLGRLVAIKVFKLPLTNTAALVRFLEEPQVTSQLGHPGVTPIHELGKMPDGRPYVVMKWVDGPTLAELLREDRSPADIPRFLDIFRQICQTVAHAHRVRGVLHRDLKPANIMVGAFGEVLVMDWGLSKVVLAGDDDFPEREQLPVETLRSGNPELATQTGVAIGTFAYMSPEQARGERDHITPRSDVFGLGAILCEVLTGHPPYWDEQFAELVEQAKKEGLRTQVVEAIAQAKQEVIRRAKKAELAAAHTRLDLSGADPQLIKLTKSCLSSLPGDRPADAGAVAEAITAYLDGLQAQVRQQEVEKAILRSRLSALRWRVVAGVVLVLALAAATSAGVWYQFQQDALETARLHQEADVATQEAVRDERVRSGLKRVTDALKDKQLETASGALDLVQHLLAAGGPGELQARARTAQREVKFAHQTEKLRQQLTVDGRQLDEDGVVGAYSRAFQEYGIDFDVPETAARMIQESTIQDQLLAALDHWVLLENYPGTRRTLLIVAQKASTTPWGRQFRHPDIHRDATALARLAARTSPEQCSPVEIESLALALRKRGGNTESLLRRGLTVHAEDYRLNLLLAQTLEGKAQTMSQEEQRRRTYEEAIGYARAALGRRGESANVHALLGRLLLGCGRLSEAVVELRLAIQKQPDEMSVHHTLVRALLLKGDLSEAKNACQEALHLLRVAPPQQREPFDKLLRQIRERQGEP
jgi:serine/threonine-protein kinase